ncbi:histone acetyltransferase 1 [Brevipalpus obovatus]|uniref:histone acetyltransferase 1 n=1 Tax=Brevipalpus obovatus TaxID=246614 RepID=UPI003D9F02AE
MTDSLMKNQLESFVCCGTNVIYLKLIRNQHDLDESDEGEKKANDEFTFQPEFCHQLFGQSENIFGYKNLRINLYYSASKLIRYMSVKYSEKVSMELSQGVPADDIYSIMSEALGGECLTNIDQFSSQLASDHTFKPHGSQMDCFNVQDKNPSNGMPRERCFEIYRCDMDVPGFESYHKNMQTFLTWFIDAASYIDTDDRKWDYFVVYERCAEAQNGNSSPNQYVYYFIGYATVYRYYAYPDKTRPRISQFLILPPFQRKGLGARLLRNIYNCYSPDCNIVEITVEDPSEEFSHLRDFVDCELCMELKSFQDSELKKGFSEEMVRETQAKYKLNRKQIRRVYEILKLRSVKKFDDEEMRSFRLEVKNRLHAPYLKMKRSPITEGDTSLHSKETRLQELNLLYNQLEEDYRQTIEKLDSAK